ncbi:MAG: hypothetical protein GF411_18815 [Candidatus Lokiarchaeota archaeon]|nr:hypothetical protein [Candidatus Lokiarchaeota archaeon]
MHENQIQSALMIGKGNRAWVPILSNVVTAGHWGGGQYTMVNLGGKGNFLCVIPLPFKCGGLRLHIDALEVGVYDADPSSKINKIHLERVTGFNSREKFDVTTQAQDSPGDKIFSFNPIDLSGSKAAYVRINYVAEGKSNLEISYIRVRCYYE